MRRQPLCKSCAALFDARNQYRNGNAVDMTMQGPTAPWPALPAATIIAVRSCSSSSKIEPAIGLQLINWSQLAALTSDDLIVVGGADNEQTTPLIDRLAFPQSTAVRPSVYRLSLLSTHSLMHAANLLCNCSVSVCTILVDRPTVQLTKLIHCMLRYASLLVILVNKLQS